MCNIHCHIWNDDHMLVTLCAPSLSVNEHLCPLSYCCYPCTSDVYSMYNVMHMTANSRCVAMLNTILNHFNCVTGYHLGL